MAAPLARLPWFLLRPTAKKAASSARFCGVHLSHYSRNIGRPRWNFQCWRAAKMQRFEQPSGLRGGLAEVYPLLFL